MSPRPALVHTIGWPERVMPTAPSAVHRAPSRTNGTPGSSGMVTIGGFCLVGVLVGGFGFGGGGGGGAVGVGLITGATVGRLASHVGVHSGLAGALGGVDMPGTSLKVGIWTVRPSLGPEQAVTANRLNAAPAIARRSGLPGLVERIRIGCRPFLVRRG